MTLCGVYVYDRSLVTSRVNVPVSCRACTAELADDPRTVLGAATHAAIDDGSGDSVCGAAGPVSLDVYDCVACCVSLGADLPPGYPA
jgi:hypothetical protein